MREEIKPPRWLGPANRVIVALQRLGLVIGTMRLPSVPGRKSGNLHTTPVSPLAVDGRRYIIGGFPQYDWVKNTREAGWGVLARGREKEQVALVELPAEERGPVLREFSRGFARGSVLRSGRDRGVPRPGVVRGSRATMRRVPDRGGEPMT